MKRAGLLMNEITSIDNLLLAFYKAKKGKEWKEPVIEYYRNLQYNLSDLQNQITSGYVKAGDYRYFTIYDPKQRQICAASFGERVLHHALMNVCHPVFEKYQVSDSYATRPGKGTFKAVERACYFQKRFQWYYKFDIRKYFDSISHSVLLTMLERQFKEKPLLTIFRKIIQSYQTEPDRGLPIGNLTSQYFANHYLGCLDHYIKENLHIPGYIRYMDDFIIWHEHKGVLKEAAENIRLFLNERLSLGLKTAILNRTGTGLSCLGFLIYPQKIFLTGRSKKRYWRKMEASVHMLRQGKLTQEVFQRCATALNSFVGHADSLYFRKKVLCHTGG